MYPKNNEKDGKPTSLDDPTRPARSDLKSVPYLSPPSSPSKTKEVAGDEAQPVEVFSSHLLSPPSTPPRQSSILTIHEKKVEEVKIDAPKLRTLLGLTDRKCGAPGRKGYPCGQWSPVAKRPAAASQLESMITLTQSSVDLEAQLEKLVSLVHCKFHDVGLPKKNRIEAWTKEFPIGATSVTDPTILLEEQIKQLLALKSTQCIRVVDDQRARCKESIGGLRVNHCALTMEEILTFKAYLNDSHLEGLLEVLERSMYCSQHTKETILQKMASWKSSIAGYLVNLPTHGEPEENKGVSEDLNAHDQSEKSSTYATDSPVSENQSLPIFNFDQDLSAYWPAIHNTSPFEIVESSGRLIDSRSSYPLIKRLINKSLVKADLCHGYIYMYEVEGNPGFVKIGYTTQPVEDRLDKWKFDCNRAPKALYPIPPNTVKAVPHARRVEALCHAELDHRRIRIYCHGCLKQHLEWFEVSSTEAIEIIQKWSNWMITEPYKMGSIKMEVTARTERMDDFMDEISAASSSGVRASNCDVLVSESDAGDMERGVTARVTL
ncbi:hypothetical protein FPOAC2_04163 [Fusarium poae]|uniref:hypothetical protein n=1 Tax=Fusarium poae TaxID=36050 RepID=UPI001CE9A5D9|nr:hypothetical protein FPOAC1_004094 [Fusarium poae]KAG8670860.1 hypothetical protein FPOAC1_004094 [Fusarium poae]